MAKTGSMSETGYGAQSLADYVLLENKVIHMNITHSIQYHAIKWWALKLS